MKRHMKVLMLLAAVPALLLAASCVGATGRSAHPVRVLARFDNRFIHTSGPGERYLEIEITAPGGLYLSGGDRPPMNIALVIDKSGSMAEAGKINYVKDAAREMVDRLRMGDRFSIVTYDDDVRVLLRSEALEDRYGAKRLIDGIYPGGSTNLGAGLVEGYRQVRRHFVPGGINRVLLLSDGLANRGITSPRELSRIAGREKQGGVSLTTFGVGLDFNEDLLASLAESGRGTYYYVDRAHRIPEILAREFSTAQQVVALDVIITIEVRPGVVIGDVMGYEYRREGNRYFVPLGDLSAGESRRLMARVSVPSLAPGEHRVGAVGMEYRWEGAGRRLDADGELSLNYVRDRAAVERNLDRDVAERSVVFEANDARRKAAARVDDGDYEGAREILEDTARKLKSAPVQGRAVKDEIAETETYQSAIEEPLSPEEKSSIQKGVKYRSYRVLQSR